MPLTAHMLGHGSLDATLEDLGRELAWETVYRTRPRALLTCTDCGGAMHAKISNRGARFFAHDRRPAHCAAVGESAEHLLLKTQLAQAARAAGFRADLEVTADHRGWRADVLVVAPDGRRTALEAQVSSAPFDEILERTSRYRDDGIETVWFTPLSARWLGHVPSVPLQHPATPSTPWKLTRPAVRRFRADPCTCDPRPPWHNSVHAGWTHPTPYNLDAIVARILDGRLVPVPTTVPLAGPPYDGWATPKDIEAAARHPDSGEGFELPYVPPVGAAWYQMWPPEEQHRLLNAAITWILNTTGKKATPRPRWTATWLAGGLGLSRTIGNSWDITSAALIRPDPGRIDWLQIGDLPVIVGSAEERRSLETSAPTDAHIIVLSGPSATGR
ncbi:competence protein CoiA family protein [Streptomyces sp. H10-C2]|uniref:competence protein CoiA n=1 Tax=unclassified Streptomyces TaxID=2593676 RepID=UPI0024B99B86|nr:MULTISPECIES: competence protein CoiA family protein [unclassified Streptomyces]MDJ0342848.1 competence protein CoiA family protein [Streptomyces sp. PH10-H1]MDJ0372526.1 competence protein CoiA family protein [Streptomyces sp. H10-C2]